MKKILLSFVVLILLSGCTVATPSGDDSSMNNSDGNEQKMNHQTDNQNLSPSSQAFRETNAKMHKDMNILLSGNADVDFVKGMIPHHQGAIDMAKIVLEYGKNEEIRELAQNIIKAQKEEIAFMKEWLQKNQ